MIIGSLLLMLLSVVSLANTHVIESVDYDKDCSFDLKNESVDLVAFVTDAAAIKIHFLGYVGIIPESVNEVVVGVYPEPAYFARLYVRDKQLIRGGRAPPYGYLTKFASNI